LQYRSNSTINRRREKGDWQESIHPSGAAYYYNDKTVSASQNFSVLHAHPM
jgi:hypothetical protein